MEDAIVFNRAAIERGLMRATEFRTSVYDFKSLALELKCKATELEFKCNPKDPDIHHLLDTQGVPHVGSIVKFNSPVLRYIFFFKIYIVINFKS